MKFLILSLALLTVGLQQTFAQEKLKEGKITFEISYPDAEDMSDQQLAMMPKETVVYFKGDKSRGETKMSYGTVTYFTDAKTKESIVCMDMMNRKTAIKSTAADE